MTKHINHFLALLALVGPLAAQAADIGYSGRLTDANGKPRGGAVDLEFKFFDDELAGTQLGTTIDADDIPLAQGMFSVTLEIPDVSTAAVFGGAETWIQVKDKTNNKTMHRQRFLSVPFALRVPVDGTTISYDPNGKLRMGPVAPGIASFLKVDAGGNLVWEAGASGSIGPNQVETSSIQDGAVTDDKINDLDGAKLTGTVDPARYSAYADLTAETKIGTGAAQVAAGNDARFTDSRAPNGNAGGVLTGTYPNPGINLAVGDIPTLTSAKISDFATAASAQDTNSKTLCPDGQFLRGETATTCRTAAEIVADGAGLTTEADPQVGANTTNYASKWDGSALVASGIYESGGSVGIGTTSPSTLAHVNGGDLSVGDETNVGRAVRMRRNGVVLGGLSTTNSRLSLFGGATPASHLAIDSSGFVGIGTYTPLTTAHINGGDLTFGDETDVTRSIRLRRNAAYIGGMSSVNGVTSLYGGSAAASHIAIDATGKVGIGMTNPAANLDIASAATGAGSVAINVSNTGAAAGTGYGAYINKTGASTTNVGLRADASGGTNNYAAVFGIGNVGVGTTTPTAKLHVGGTAGVDGIKFPDGTLQTTAAAGGGGGMRIRQSQFVNSTTQLSSANTTWVDYLTLSFTPQSATSKIVIRADVAAYSNFGAFNDIRLIRDATQLGIDKRILAATGTEQVNTWGGMGFAWQENSPGTSAVIYKIQFRRGGGTNTAYLNSGELLIQEIE